MSLKKSFFNLGIFKSDIKRFWWLSLAETILLFLICVWTVLERLKSDIYSYGSKIPSWENPGIIVLIAFSVGIGVVLFSYIHSNASVSMHYSMPIKRSTFLFTKINAGIVLTYLPIIANAVVFAVILAVTDYSDAYTYADILRWLVSGILYTTVFLTLTVFVNLMTGNPIGTLIFTCGFSILPWILLMFFDGFFDQNVYGYSNMALEKIISYIYIGERNLVKLPYALIYIGLIALFITGAYFLNKTRKLENHGEVIAFSWLKPVFIAIISVLTSMLGYLYFNEVMSKTGPLWILPFGILGTVIASMISRKSLSVKGSVIPVAFYIAVALVFCAFIRFDIVGYERRIPDISKVQSARIIHGEEADYDFTKPEDITNVISLHKHMIDNRKEGSNDVIPIEYTLKNGRKISRNYQVDFREDKEYLKPLYETKQMKLNHFPILDKKDKEFVSLNISDRRIDGNESIAIYPDNPYMTKLIDAITQDINETTYEEFVIDGGASITIGVNYNKMVNAIGDYSKVDSLAEYYSIRQSYKNTLEVLKKMGYLDKLPTQSDIKYADVYVWHGSDYMSEKEAREKAVTGIDDKEELYKLYSNYQSMIETRKYTDYENAYNVRIVYKLNDGREFVVSSSYDEENLPMEFSKYF